MGTDIWRNVADWLYERSAPRVREIQVMLTVSDSRPFVPELHGTKPLRLSLWTTYEIIVNERYQHEVTDYLVRDGLLYFTKSLAPGDWVTVIKC